MARASALENQIFNELYDLVTHQITVEGVPSPVGEYIIFNLFMRGWLLNDLPTDKIYTGALSGVDRYGRVTKAYGRSEDGREFIDRTISYDPDPLGCYVVWYSRTHEAPASVLRTYASQLATIRTAQLQNIKACTSPAILRLRDPKQKKALERAFTDKADGVPVIFLDEDPTGLKVENLNPPFVADRYADQYNAIREEFLGRFGFLTRVDKRERVQNDETNAVLGYAHDSIYTALDFINAQCFAYHLPWRVRMGGTLDELYTDALKEGNNNDV